MLDLAGNSDPIVRLALLAGQISAIVTLMLLVYTFLLRTMLVSTRRRKRVFLQTWRPLIADATLPDYNLSQIQLPRLARRDVLFFLQEWNVVHDCVRGSARDSLNLLARRLNIDRVAWRLVRRRNRSKKLIGTVTLGHLRNADAWDEFVKQMQAPNTAVSMIAAAALIEINASKAMEHVTAVLVQRRDWPAARMATLMQYAGPDAVSAWIARAIQEAPVEKVPRLIPFLKASYRLIADRVIRRLLGTSDSEPVIAACLREVDSPYDLPLIRSYTQHTTWYVRMLAATALGRLGESEDIDALVRLLKDQEWWVRYRAAQALNILPFVGPNQLRRIQHDQDDRYARDIMRQAMTEKGLA